MNSPLERLCPDSDPVRLGSYVRGRQDELGISAKQVCGLSGIDASIYSKKINGVFSFTAKDLIDVGKALGEIIAGQRLQPHHTKNGPLAVSPAAARCLPLRKA